MKITHADPVIECPGEWLDRVVNWGIGRWRTPIAHGPDYVPGNPFVDLVSFGDSDRTWTYRVTEYNLLRNVFTLAWPD